MSTCHPSKTDRADDLRPGLGQLRDRDQRSGVVMTVAMRRQTPEEQRRFEAACDLLLSEMVRQEMGRRA